MDDLEHLELDLLDLVSALLHNLNYIELPQSN